MNNKKDTTIDNMPEEVLKSAIIIFNVICLFAIVFMIQQLSDKIDELKKELYEKNKNYSIEAIPCEDTIYIDAEDYYKDGIPKKYEKIYETEGEYRTSDIKSITGEVKLHEYLKNLDNKCEHCGRN